MEKMVTPNPSFWKGKNVLVTGHTGFKGAWLSQWLISMGANVSGISLSPKSNPNLYSILNLEHKMKSVLHDISNLKNVGDIVSTTKPEIIFHLAAQALVHDSYEDPLGTFKTNILGTANLLETIRGSRDTKVFINVTSDKCYQNDELSIPFVESDKMGGNDIYSCSKGCSELITVAYRKSFYDASKTMIATARAGNVIGGGDWAQNRLVPDIIRAFSKNEKVSLRSPYSIRPWQHVLEPLSGYLLLSEKLWMFGDEFEGAWNFGPGENGEITVERLTELMAKEWGQGVDWFITENIFPPESSYLRLNCEKAKMKLAWQPVLSIEDTINWTVSWYKNMYDGRNMETVTVKQIDSYMGRGAQIE